MLKPNASRHIAIRILPAVLWAAFIFSISSFPVSDRLPPLFPHADKVAHLVLYAVLGWLILRAGRREWIAPPWPVWFLVAWIIGSAYGATDEWHQILVPQRDCSLADWIVDALGAALGEACYLFYFKMRCGT